MHTYSLQGRRFVVTGATRGIGRAISLALGANGAHILMLGRNALSLDALLTEVQALGGEGQGLVVDFTQPNYLVALDDSMSKISKLDGLIHCAGVCGLGTVEQTSPEVLDLNWQVNLRAPYVLTSQLLPRVRAARGHVIFINSGAGKVAKRQWSAYAASKHGLKALADALRDEVAGDGIRVTSVFPGRTATDMQEQVRSYEGKSYNPAEWVQPEDVAQAVILALKTPYPALVDEISVRPMPPLAAKNT